MLQANTNHKMQASVMVCDERLFSGGKAMKGAYEWEIEERGDVASVKFVQSHSIGSCVYIMPLA